jgi:hypothetical protein
MIQKDQHGNVIVREVKELDTNTVRVLDPPQVEVTSMITRTDIDNIAAGLDNNSPAAAMLFENLWAIKTKQAMLDANARVLMFERIPKEFVEENLLEIATIAGSQA